MLLAATPPDWKLLFSLTYGCGLRLNEALNLRIKDVMLNRDLVIVQTGKGGKSRSLPFPTNSIRFTRGEFFFINIDPV